MFRLALNSASYSVARTGHVTYIIHCTVKIKRKAYAYCKCSKRISKIHRAPPAYEYKDKRKKEKQE